MTSKLEYKFKGDCYKFVNTSNLYRSLLTIKREKTEEKATDLLVVMMKWLR